MSKLVSVFLLLSLLVSCGGGGGSGDSSIPGGGNTGGSGGGGSQGYYLTVNISGNGAVVSSPVGIACPGFCSAQFQPGTQVTLTAAADQGYQFSEWLGDCSGSQLTCTLVIDGNKTVTAKFVPVSQPNAFTPDSTFGSGGFVNTAYGSGITHFTTVAEVNGGYLVGGTDAVCLINYNGQFVQNFGVNGCVVHGLKRAYTFELVQSGFVMVGLNNSNNLIIRRYDMNGNLVKETDAGPAGYYFFSFRSCKFGSNIVFAGGSGFVVVNDQGDLVNAVYNFTDADFATSEDRMFYGIAGVIHDGNRLLLYGKKPSGKAFVVAVDATGNVDTSWGNNGWFEEGLFLKSAFMSALKLADGRLAFGGLAYTTYSTGSKRSVIFVLSANGTTIEQVIVPSEEAFSTTFYSLKQHGNRIIASGGVADNPPHKYKWFQFQPKLYSINLSNGTVDKWITLNRPGGYVQYAADMLIDQNGKLVIASSESNGYNNYDNFRALVMRLNL